MLLLEVAPVACLVQFLQDLYFHQALDRVLLFVLYYFHCMFAACHQIHALHHLPKRALSQVLHDFVFHSQSRRNYLVLRQHVFTVAYLDFIVRWLSRVRLVNIVQSRSVVFNLV